MIPICPHCIKEFVVAGLLALPFVGIFVAWLKSKFSKKSCDCKCHKEEKNG